MNAAYRAIAILQEKSGFNGKLLEYTLGIIPQITTVDGVEKVEVNTVLDDPSRVILYYWWRSPDDLTAYTESDLYKEIMGEVMKMSSEHTVFVMKNDEST